jgi:hypothetical protein
MATTLVSVGGAVGQRRGLAVAQDHVGPRHQLRRAPVPVMLALPPLRNANRRRSPRRVGRRRRPPAQRVAPSSAPASRRRPLVAQQLARVGARDPFRRSARGACRARQAVVHGAPVHRACEGLQGVGTRRWSRR